MGGILQHERLSQNIFQLLPCPSLFSQPLGPLALKGTPKSPLFTVPHTSRVTPVASTPQKTPKVQSDRKQPGVPNTASQGPLSHPPLLPAPASPAPGVSLCPAGSGRAPGLGSPQGDHLGAIWARLGPFADAPRRDCKPALAPGWERFPRCATLQNSLLFVSPTKLGGKIPPSSLPKPSRSKAVPAARPEHPGGAREPRSSSGWR